MEPGDKYTHNSFTLLQTTQQIRDVVDHILGQPDSEVPTQLRKDLNVWKHEEEEERRKKCPPDSVEDVSSTIAFNLIKRAHKQLEKTPLESGRVYLHELINGSRLVLPSLVLPPRNPELVKRLERIKREQEQKEYDKMVSNVDNSKKLFEKAKLGLEVQATSRQLWMFVNFLVTVIGAFVFGYCAAGAVGYEMPTCVFIGLFMGVLVFIADLYFLIKSPTIMDPHQHNTTASKTIEIKDKKS